MKNVVSVELGTRRYSIIIAEGLLRSAGEILDPFLLGRRPIIVTDENVARHHLADLVAALGRNAHPIILPAGEARKSWATLEQLCDELIAVGVERQDTIIALGGGVIGDLVGFAAAILKRGCRFAQIPTTLLSQVDSSVGGKTAINTRGGKNLIGAFHQPAAVLIDPNVLDTLPDREMRAGYAEVAKYGLINNLAFFEWCESNGALVLSGDREAQIKAIETSVRAKAEIVVADERETDDLRALLNLGHTFGHALEAETGFSAALVHGEAVAAGMALAYRFSAWQGLCSSHDTERVSAHLRAVGLPDGLRAANVGAGGERLVAHMLHDKKMSGGTLPFILAKGIGQAYVDKNVALTDVAAFLDTELR
jgi:3-dehydroquinate synthase